jgi:hypothetical protein
MTDINSLAHFPPLPSAPDSAAKPITQIESPDQDGEVEEVHTPQDRASQEKVDLPDQTNEGGLKESQGYFISNDIADDVLGYDGRLESVEAYTDRISRDHTGYVIFKHRS